MALLKGASGTTFLHFRLTTAYGKRFLPDQVFLVDGTFKTNRVGLVLLIVRVINTNRNFPVAYSFAKS